MPDFNESISRAGVLDGITWRVYATDANFEDAIENPELHIGSIGNFQIHLSRSVSDNSYRMQLWEMAVVPQYDQTTSRSAAVPQYTILIPDVRIWADNADSAKLQAVSAVLNFIGEQYTAAVERYNGMLSLFGDLGAVLNRKTIRRRGTDPVEHLGLSGRAVTILNNNKVYVIGDLASKTAKQIKDMDGVGDAALNEILKCLHKANIRLADEPSGAITMAELTAAQAAEKNPVTDDEDEPADDGAAPAADENEGATNDSNQ